ncbi:hypothetical protein STAFG_7180 [Streptomyces afghaniensis 772]|uniref:Uncharacterized protein n=1 Tax=Streptomyces afghaniensis 772 TaxID=1283301 RepID=S4MJL7_9ACTN|nr:hypothetical protein STAFG_7180 [Streptomyces afghaniensis 772]
MVLLGHGCRGLLGLRGRELLGLRRPFGLGLRLGAQAAGPTALARDRLRRDGRLLGQIVVDVAAPAGQGQHDEDDGEEALRPQPRGVADGVVVGDVQRAAGAGSSKPWAQPSTVVGVSGLPSSVAVQPSEAVSARRSTRPSEPVGIVVWMSTGPAATVCGVPEPEAGTMVARATSWSICHSAPPFCWLSRVRPGVASRTRVTSRGAPWWTRT